MQIQTHRSVFLMLALIMGLFAATAGANDTPFYLASANATVTNGNYDQANQVIRLNNSGSAVYTVGDEVNGSFSNGIFDVYLEASKLYSFSSNWGTTPYRISVNGDRAVNVPIIQTRLSTSSADLYDMGVFLVLEHVALKAGDTITIDLLPGFSMGKPALGDLILYRPGEKVAVGFDGAFPDKQPADPHDPLSGLQLVWLGSSVTHGLMADGFSMADFLEERHNRLESSKYAVSGTTLVDIGRDNPNPSSYVSRMKAIPLDIRPDYFIVQLSTNDATSNPPKPIGTFTDSTNLSDFDTSTVYGAIQYIIVYASQTWHCPVVFFTGTQNKYAAYENMRTALLDIQNQWGIGVIDLFKDLSATDPNYSQYMKSDTLHPTADGYRLWWGPVFEEYLTSFVTGEPMQP